MDNFIWKIASMEWERDDDDPVPDYPSPEPAAETDRTNILYPRISAFVPTEDRDNV